MKPICLDREEVHAYDLKLTWKAVAALIVGYMRLSKETFLMALVFA